MTHALVISSFASWQLCADYSVDYRDKCITFILIVFFNNFNNIRVEFYFVVITYNGKNSERGEARKLKKTDKEGTEKFIEVFHFHTFICHLMDIYIISLHKLQLFPH